MNPVPAAAYGADASGFVCGFRFTALGGGVAISAEQALASVLEQAQALASAERSPTGTAFVWLHFNLAHTAAIKWMPQNLRLSACVLRVAARGLALHPHRAR